MAKSKPPSREWTIQKLEEARAVLGLLEIAEGPGIGLAADIPGCCGGMRLVKRLVCSFFKIFIIQLTMVLLLVRDIWLSCDVIL